MNVNSVKQSSRTYYALVVCALLSLVPDVAGAQQASAISETGFQRNRDYLALQPFETIDTAAGNVLLTFVDLELPGNTGGTLRFERRFINHKRYGPSGVPPLQWQFGVNGLPLHVAEREVYWASDLGSLDWHRRSTAILFMPDGSRQEMVFENTPILSDETTLRWMITPQFWRYDRQDNKLYVPDGTVATYGADGWLTSFADRFGNVVTLAWSSGALQVTQALGNGQSRVIDVELDPTTRLPRR